ncbi:hypothetical protein I8752_29295 [Nostocaceae cyanobacterium CENA369]|uniref:Uncharacterized protein n=1 Tax=Dendronalium phyllosphericum CENA369 TaxID=1725256 RepID=A0A8J7I6M8_9NOST|nr:hypothetical protein [Dendronalium phyllosphericum]MBH8577006.1 hypothetical protein [Dendronalium phyllosphericum CENA369]
MPEDIKKSYVQRYIRQAQSTNDEALKNNALYRAGTHMEVIPCSGNDNLTPEQQKTVLNAAAKLLGGDNAGI